MSTAETTGRSEALGGESPPRSTVRSVDDPMIGTVIAGRYRVEARLGEGGMGAVYRVEHTHMRKRLALKVLHREMSGQTEIVARFEREAMAAAHIEHPNVAGATDFGKLEDGAFYLVLEYVEGTSLRGVIDNGPLTPARAVHIALQIMGALKRAHELGIVHRDLKPENVLLVEKDGDADFVKVLDFGIARVPIGSLGTPRGPEQGPLTRAGMVYGTPEYMAPEQALGQDVDGRSDLYGVGVMLFEMLAGKRPYDNKDKVALLGQHVAGAIPSVRERAPKNQFITVELDSLVSRMLAKSPGDRFGDAGAAAEALMSLGFDVALPVTRHPSFRGGTEPIGAPPPSGGTVQIVSTDRSQVTLERIDLSANDPAPAPTPTRPLPTHAQPTVAPSEAATGGRSSTLFMSLAGLAIALLGVALYFVTRPTAGTNEPDRGPRAAAMPAAASVQPPPSAAASGLKAKAQSALGRVASGEVEAGLHDLEALAEQYPTEPAVLRGLAQGYSRAKRHIDALGAVKRLLGAAQDAASDPALDPIFDEALADPSAVESVFSVLQGPMGTEGGRILYDLAYGTRGPAAVRPRAQKALADPEVHRTLSPAIRGALELRAAPFVCGARRSILEKYRGDLDFRAVPLLTPMTKATGCGGFFKKQDCWPCLREDKLLETILRDIDARSKSMK